MRPYYLIASLPRLILGEQPPLTRGKLLDQCSGLLEADELRELAGVLDGRMHPPLSRFARRWLDLDTTIRNAAARARGGRLGVEPGPYLRPLDGYDTFSEKAVLDAYTTANPLEREMAIDQCRWQLLEEIASEDPFSFPALLAYAVKLRLAERWAEMTVEAGGRTVKERVDELEGLPVAAGQA